MPENDGDNSDYKIATRAVRTGQFRSQEGEHSDPIFLTSSYVCKSAADAAARFSGEVEGNIYSRFTNPTVRTFEERLAAMEEGECCVATATGMSAIVATCMGLLSAGDHGSTFGGNYLSATAASTVIDILKEYADSGELAKTTEYFNQELEKFFSAHRRMFTSKVGIGMMCGLRVKNADTLAQIISNAKDEGVMVLKAGRNTLRFLPPLTITKEEIDEGFKSLNRAVASL